jgi:serine/threonine protein kinase
VTFNVREEDWLFALSYLAEKPNGTKLSRKTYFEKEPHYLHHSFIRIDGIVYALARQKLGTGSFSKVKLCQNRKKEVYAIKIQNAPNMKQNKYEENELKIERDLDLLVAIGQRTDSPKKVFIIKYLGTNFCDYLNLNEAQLPISEILSLFIQCATEVADFHQGTKSRQGKKYLHCDIKLENFVIDDRAKISLIDFGFSCLIPEKGIADNMKIQGTEGFMAPEVFQGVRSVATEVYALGALLEDMFYNLPILENSWSIQNMHRAMRDENPVNRPSIETIINESHQWIRNTNTQILNTAASVGPINNQDLLSFAIIYKIDQEATQCLAAGADVNKKNAHGYTPLMEAVRGCYTTGMNLLLNHPQIDFFAQDKGGKTAEYYAHRAGFYDQLISAHTEIIKAQVVKALHSANPAAEINKNNLLAWTAYYQCVQEFLMCVDAGGNINNIKPITGRLGQVKSLLFWALEHCNRLVIVPLLLKGAHINTRNNQGNWPIDVAMQHNDVSMVLLLLYFGADMSPIVEAYLLDQKIQVIEELEQAVQFPGHTSEEALCVVNAIKQLYTAPSTPGSHKSPTIKRTRFFQETPNLSIQQNAVLNKLVDKLHVGEQLQPVTHTQS